MEFSKFEFYYLMNLPGVKWLANVDLSHTELDYIDLNNAILYKANLSHSSLDYANFCNANLIDKLVRSCTMAEWPSENSS